MQLLAEGREIADSKPRQVHQCTPTPRAQALGPRCRRPARTRHRARDHRPQARARVCLRRLSGHSQRRGGTTMKGRGGRAQGETQEPVGAVRGGGDGGLDRTGSYRIRSVRPRPGNHSTWRLRVGATSRESIRRFPGSEPSANMTCGERSGRNRSYLTSPVARPHTAYSASISSVESLVTSTITLTSIPRFFIGRAVSRRPSCRPSRRPCCRPSR